MPLETEIKLRVDRHEPVRESLRAAGATFIKRELEINTFLDTPESSLMKSGNGLRVREAINEETKQHRCVITHKGPRKAGPMKIREETELTTESYKDAIKLLAQLGFEVKMSFEKKRETWEMDKTEIVLDELPDELGRFVEIGGPDEKAVQTVCAMLGLGEAVVEPETYAMIIAAYLKKTQRCSLAFTK